MSVETLTIVLSAIGIVVTLGGSTFAGMAWMVRRMDVIAARGDANLVATRTELKGDIAELRTELKGDIADVRTELTDVKRELSDVKRELSDVKVSVARWEGPPRHLTMAR